jgi:hypothetical protein
VSKGLNYDTTSGGGVCENNARDEGLTTIQLLGEGFVRTTL